MATVDRCGCGTTWAGFKSVNAWTSSKFGNRTSTKSKEIHPRAKGEKYGGELCQL